MLSSTRRVRASASTVAAPPGGRAAPTRRHGVADPADPAATDLLRLRVAAGMLATTGAAADGGGDIEGLSDRCRRALEVATAVGAPLLDAVDTAAAAEDDHRRAARAVHIASAQTRAVAIGLIGAPVLLVPALGRLVGADLVGFYTSGLGLLVLAVGLLLLAAGAAIIAVLVRRVGRRVGRGEAGRAPTGVRGLLAAAGAGWLAWKLVGAAVVPVAALLGHHLASRSKQQVDDPPGVDEAADLAATALAGGVGIPHAVRIAADHLPDLAVPLRRLAFELELGIGPPPITRAAEALGPGLARMRSVLVAAGEVGAAVAPALRRLASDLRADDLAQVLAAAERLPAQLTFPTALCLLPATVLLIGAPIVHAGLLAAGT